MRQASGPRTMRSLQPRPAKAPPHRRSRRALRRSAIDPVDAAIILGAFETICYEMATHVSLTATTPILNQSNERNATILDGTGQLAALSVGIPQFMLSSTLPVRFAVEFFGPGGLHDGDVLVGNDPYHGGGHDPVPPRRHGGWRSRGLQRERARHLGGGSALPGRQDLREGRQAPRRRVHDGGEQPHTDLSRRPPRAGGRGAARRPPPAGGARALRDGDGRRRRAGDHRARQATVPGGGRTLARRRLRIGHLRRSRPPREARHPRPLSGDRQGQRPAGRLHRLRRAPRHPGVLDLRQHARLRRGAARLHDGSDHPEERGFLRLDRARRAEGLLPQPPRGQVGGGRHPPPGNGGGGGSRQGPRAGRPGAELPADLQDGYADGDLRHASERREGLHRPFG
ncbi:MAG: hydantoinase B/oxoprolinase family protein [Deltaproteobacteria bacterium]|nr:MAG: hydantoinase B/oxoprolinase family protein [Deltaproteobacteria bacterium]